MQAVLLSARSQLCVESEPGLARRFAYDDQGMHEQQVSGLRAFRVYRLDALRALPMGSEERAENQRRGKRQPRTPQRSGCRCIKEGARNARGKIGDAHFNPLMMVQPQVCYYILKKSSRNSHSLRFVGPAEVQQPF
jgi:hypothetical protein